MNYAEIITLIDNKDRKGWEALYALYGKKFYGFAVDKWHFDTDEAWDIVHQTLQTIILKIGEYDIKSQLHFDNLLFKILTNFLRQQYRKNRKIAEDVKFLSYQEMDSVLEAGEEMNEIGQIEVPYNMDFFQNYLNEHEDGESPQLKALQVALLKLDSVDRELLLLRANDYSYEQIADMLKIENNQLKVRHHRAKNKLIKLLQPK